MSIMDAEKFSFLFKMRDDQMGSFNLYERISHSTEYNVTITMYLRDVRKFVFELEML